MEAQAVHQSSETNATQTNTDTLEYSVGEETIVDLEHQDETPRNDFDLNEEFTSDGQQGTQLEENNSPNDTKQVPQEKQRQTWNNRINFLLAALGAAIGFGNFFRFPYLVYSSGGGAFLIPYTIAVFCIGIPLLLFEMSLGNLFKTSSVFAMKYLNKRAGGVGLIAVLYGSYFITTYYSVILAWVLVYLFYTFRSELPYSTNSEEFFMDWVLQKSSGPLDFTGISWPVLGSTILIWTACYFCVFKGVKSSGWVVWVTVPLPFLLVIILLVRSLFLDGAIVGISYYLYPNFALLLDVKVWLAAAGQIFFSLGLGSGVQTAYSSYTKQKQNMIVDAIIVTIFDCIFSFIAGLAVFAVLGYMATQQGVPIESVTRSGLGLSFITFPQAVSMLPLPHVFAVILFLTMLTLGIDSLFAMTEAMNSVIHDRLHGKVPNYITALITCLVGLVLAVPYTLKNGYYLMDILDHYISDYCLIIIGVSECLVVGWFAAPVSIISKFKNLRLGIIETGRAAIVPTLKLCYHIIFHSAEEHRIRISRNSKFGLPFVWNISVKFAIPLVLTVLGVIAFVNELMSPYSSVATEGFDWLALCSGLLLVGSCIGVIILFCIAPGLAGVPPVLQNSEVLDVTIALKQSEKVSQQELLESDAR